MTANDGARRGAAARNGLHSIVRDAVSAFSDLSGKAPEQISGLRSTDDGWSVLVEVLDLERVPSTTSVLSTYRVDLNGDGELVGYERIRRYTRASTDSQ